MSSGLWRSRRLYIAGPIVDGDAEDKELRDVKETVDIEKLAEPEEAVETEQTPAVILKWKLNN